MPIRIKVAPARFDVAVNKLLSPRARQELIAAFARGRIAEADAKNARALGSSPPKTVTVDGREGASLESVNPDRGVIIAEWSLAGEVLEWIRTALWDRSPLISGDYRRGHVIYADGAEVSGDQVPLAREYVFLNLVPYSRKIEIGKTKAGRDFVIQVENRIYERTADDARARFGNIAKIRFTYQSAIGGGRSADRVPAILVTL